MTTKQPIRDNTATHAALLARLPTNRVDTSNHDKFTLLPSQMVPGVTREWKAHTVLGEHQLSEEAEYRQQGWIPVETAEAPELMPPGTAGSDPIIRGGQMLWQRRAELTEQSRQQDRHNAIAQKRSKTQQLSAVPDGHLGRKVNNLNSTVETWEATVPKGGGDEPL